uniref:Interferon-induced very large GTPase 1 domain-containing protein n=1 Tax=Xenopus tropicalis TaxID=8364 RepID=A0A1B8XV92_XENTR
MLDLLQKYFKNKENNVHLIEKYREDFSRRVHSLQRELNSSAELKIDEAIKIQKQKRQLNNIQKTYKETIEEKVANLIEQVRERKSQLGDDEIEKEFENMWESTMAELPKHLLQKRNVSQEMLLELKRDLSNRGSSIKEKLLSVKHLEEFGKDKFQIKDEHIDLKWYSLKGVKQFWNNECHDKTASLAFSLIRRCSKYVSEKDKIEEDYDGTYCQELLNIINERLREEDAKKLHITHEFDLDLKLHVLGSAARMFGEMHLRFLNTDPILCLERLKPHYFTTFKNIFQEKDETQSRTK